MKWFLLFSFLLSTTVFAKTTSFHESARGKSTALGIILGYPTGISGELNATSQNPINFGVAYSFSHWAQFWADYTFRFPGFVGSTLHEPSDIDAYIGVGAGLAFFSHEYRKETAGLLARIPFGLEYKLRTAPFGFMAELVPGLLIVPATDFIFEGGVGGRFYF